MPLFSKKWPRVLIWTCLLVFLITSRSLRSAFRDNNRKKRVVDVAALARKEDKNNNSGNSERCWIFTHMPKSGGSTVKAILYGWFGRENAFLYNSDAWKLGEKHAASFELQDASRSRRWRLAAGGYAEVLRRHGGQRCTWFTLFRHPISRLVSAFYFCRKKPRDQACASAAVLADDVDLVAFARLWGSYGLRQFSLGGLDVDAVMRSARSDEEREKLPGWYLVKQLLLSMSGGDDADAALVDALEPAKALLRDEYTAVGILEEFNTTLHLFDSVLAMPGLDWISFGRQRIVNKNKKFGRAETAAALEAAWNDERIKHFLRLDIELYEHAVRVFHDQATQAGMYPG